MAKDVCPGPKCVRPVQVKGLCKAHYAQHRRRNGELTALGDRERQRRMQGEYWAAMPVDERARKLRRFVGATHGKPRGEQWLDRLSTAHKARWESGIAAPKDARVCKACLVVFQPNSGRHVFCTIECERSTRRFRKYGLTTEQYANMLRQQGNRCALCGLDWHGWCSQKTEMPHIDHCHKTGKVRGLLCGDCNTALGRFGDDPAKLRAAIAYLEGVAADEEVPCPGTAEVSPAA